MKLVGIRNLKIGEALSSPIRMFDGRILLPKGAVLSEKFINRLKGIGVLTVYVDDANFDDIDAIEVITDETKAFAFNQINAMFVNSDKGKEFDLGDLKEVVKQISEEVRSATRPLSLVNTFAIEDERVLHAFNVCVYTVAMSITQGYNLDVIEELGLAGILHDIKLKNQNDDLVNKKHTEEAFRYIKEERRLSAKLTSTVYNHHEYRDASGFPRGVAVDEVFAGAEMMSIVDMYESLLNGYWSKDHAPMRPDQAYKQVCSMAGGKYSLEVIQCFMKSITVYPNGVMVKLSTGEKGIILRQNENDPTKPIVRLLDGSKKELDLLKNPKIFVENVEI